MEQLGLAGSHDPETWLRNLPKAELHLHLEGSITPATLMELSRTNDTVPLTLDQACRVYDYTDFPTFLMSFKAVTERLHAPVDYETITYNMLRDLAIQGVKHAEVYLSIGILYRFARLDVDAVMEAAERGRWRGERDFGVSLLWIIDAVRHFGAKEGAKVFQKAAALRESFPSIVGIGIGGDEARGPAHEWRDVFAEARAMAWTWIGKLGAGTSAVSPGPRRARHMWLNPSFEPIVATTSWSGSRLTSNRRA